MVNAVLYFFALGTDAAEGGGKGLPFSSVGIGGVLVGMVVTPRSPPQPTSDQGATTTATVSAHRLRNRDVMTNLSVGP